MRKKSRILVVEDEALMGEVLCDLMEDEGLQPLGPATAVGVALQMVNDLRLDAAMLDVKLGSELAYPVAHALKANGVPFVLVTGYPRDQLPADMASAPMVEKPFDPAALRDTVRGLLRPSARRRGLATVGRNP